jgi:hypothetical protein
MTYGQHGTNLPNSHVPGILARRAREGAQVCGCMVANVDSVTVGGRKSGSRKTNSTAGRRARRKTMEGGHAVPYLHNGSLKFFLSI